MPAPSHLPAALVADPPIDDDDLATLVQILADQADDDGTDVATVVDSVIGGMDTTDTGPSVPEIAVGYRLPDLGAAEWAMRKMREAHEHLTAVEAQAMQWAREVADYAERESRAAAATATYMAGLLEDYTRRRRDEDPNVKTVRLLSGVVETTAHKASVEVVDEAALVEWAREHAPTAVVEVPVSYKVPAAAVKALGSIVEDHHQEAEDGPVVTVRSFVTAGGEKVPGVEVKAPRLAVRVKPG